MLGVCYYPEHWPADGWEADAVAMRAVGISLVRIGEFAWSRLEPEPGRLEWGWLDRAIAVLADAGLKVILCTPTATPPKWLVDAHPDILPSDRDGRTRAFGSRRHTSFSSPSWQRETSRIVRLLAERYGRHPAIAGWQIDNEFGCHDTVASHGPDDLRAFRAWLRNRHGDGGAIDRAWGNVFWSMELGDPAQAALPVGTVTEANPAALLDFRRFGSEAVAAYGRQQTEIIRAHSPDRFVTHNYMGRFFDFDHWDAAAPLDLATWDSYPLGFTQEFCCTSEERVAYAETGLPDMAALHHDLYRGVGRGRFAVMEQQAGPVNWARWNPAPKPGMVRLWTWEALAHGAEFVSFFRWRQLPFAQEQMHSGLQRPDRQPSRGGEEAAIVGRELASFGDLPATVPAPVALIVDYAAAWVTRIQPQAADFDFFEETLRWYEAVRRLGLDVDVVRPGASLAGYRLVLAPCLPIVDAAASSALEENDAVVVFGTRAGSKTPDFAIPPDLPPGPLRSLLPIKITEIGSLPPEMRYPVDGELAGSIGRWREWIDAPGAAVLASFADGAPAVIRCGRAVYVAGVPNAGLRNGIARTAARAAGLSVVDLPEGVRMRRRGPLSFAFNYGARSWTVPDTGSARWLLGDAELGPQQVGCWRQET